MMPYRIPPAGSHIHWSDVVDEAAVRGLFTPWEGAFFDSGTAALAGLLLTLRQRMAPRDEVILAAYNCPDMISAARYAGCVPRLVDLAPGRPWMELAQVERALSPRTLAVVAVDLFGIPERIGPLRELAIDNGSICIQDSAQGFPQRAGDGTWQGDAVILSFGRGKPVSLLAGGAVLSRDRGVIRDVARTMAEPPGQERQHARRVAAYNLLRHPRLYWLPASLPSLGLGTTRFEPLEAIGAMPSWVKRRVPTAVAAYRARSGGIEAQYAAMGLTGGLVDLARSCGLPPAAPLSRYPLLAPEAASRDALCERLRNFGASPFYGRILPEVEGLEELLAGAGPFPVAREFAARLLTLPTHDGVRATDVGAIRRVLGGGPLRTMKPVGESAG